MKVTPLGTHGHVPSLKSTDGSNHDVNIEAGGGGGGGVTAHSS